MRRNPFPGRVKRAGLRNQCPEHGQVEWVRLYQCMSLCCQCDNRLTQDPVELTRRKELLQELADNAKAMTAHVPDVGEQA